ncbi:hypothetical protein K239x_30220 [Planctomycetes bacterium K23_9]|uniref:Uncharacterized protein n=1 Tax=Stieleria marina TaxID=1930275 RepID=A0A517NV79_9BACT|nr:hypothetical protein K239x_30220 [Planctomycetes bacterium K23_9]
MLVARQSPYHNEKAGGERTRAVRHETGQSKKALLEACSVGERDGPAIRAVDNPLGNTLLRSDACFCSVGDHE